MKSAYLLALFTVLCLNIAPRLFAQSAQQPAQPPAEPKPTAQKLLGKCTLAELQKSPYNEWFDKVFAEYAPSKAVLERLTAHDRRNITVQIFFGTWCGDSKREVPRFAKMLREVGIPDAAVEYIALDDADSVYDMIFNKTIQKY